MLRPTFVVPTVALFACVLGTASPASAQGCILLRQTSPAFGTAGAVTAEPGTFEITLTGRNSQADHHYNGTVYQEQRQTQDTYVLNQQNSVTATITYQATNRVSLNVGVPWVVAAWGIPSPQSSGEAARANENARGIGDITSVVRYSILSPRVPHSWNLLVGTGIKVPTGNDGAIDTFPDSKGANNLPRYVDISANPGDGGFGIIGDIQGFKAMGRFTLFGSGTYMANPRDQGAPVRGTLASAADTATSFNTVSDQYVTRIGTQVVVTRRVTASIAWRAEGVPRYDLIGRSDGFRRPGVEMYWEPGLSINVGNQTFSFNMPVGYYFNREPNPYTGASGDATFPKYVAIGTYSYRFGKGAHMATHPGITDTPNSVPTPGGLDRNGRPQGGPGDQDQQADNQ
ncbi:MAG TPA: hypothetical protein VHZ73_01965 [Vicinamibacterales bacterium]|nr:hypothetical protein [Vicinamibacterales bacterium]